MLFRIGFILMMIGTCLIDSESLVLPMLITGTGALLMWISAGRRADDAN